VYLIKIALTTNPQDQSSENSKAKWLLEYRLFRLLLSKFQTTWLCQNAFTQEFHWMIRFSVKYLLGMLVLKLLTLHR